MERLLIFFFALLFPLTLFSQRTKYSSTIYDGITYIPISGASIYNCNTKTYSFSNKKGFFEIFVQPNDTIIISQTGYHQLLVVLNQEDIMLSEKWEQISKLDTNVYNFDVRFYYSSDKSEIATIPSSLDTIPSNYELFDENMIRNIMEKREYLLFPKEINLQRADKIRINPDYDAFIKELSKFNLPGIYSIMGGKEPTEAERISIEYARKNIQSIKLSEWEIANIEYATQGPNLLRNTGFASPITWLYNKFSKKVRMERLYREMVEYGEETDRVPEKYNKELVAKITGLKDDVLMEFMVFCRFSYYDLVRWSDAEIIAAIKYKFSEYEYYKVLEEEQDMITKPYKN
jgi:hypothetical protein